MKSAVLILLFITLVFSDGRNNSISSNVQPEINLFSNWSTPCQKSQNKNAFNTFMSRHILLLDFDTTQLSYWGYYLAVMGLCGRTLNQSFLNKRDTRSIMRVCNGEGIRYTNNMCISREKFLVFIVKSESKSGECKFQLQFEIAHVIIACEAIERVCLPVHYEGQADTAPPEHGEICRSAK
ncbi:uncharacterized protein LOC127515724 [Ctenopharyngodon idella]|uniref:uncharacterized protein LOC127515724 n=1 Tax=Ctenopharyngodon idella TaxID=7959 RepID=UPI00222FBB99|nr:uncharacterized protein LOC127515724 [Ctenopharyngodon idella]